MEKLNIRSLRSLLFKQCKRTGNKKIITQLPVSLGEREGGGVPPSLPPPPPATAPSSAPLPQTAASPAPTDATTTPAHLPLPSREPCRRLLPAALFLLTFFTVMTVLLVYMDTTAMRHQQFRLNMSREYEMEGVSQDAAQLVEYIRRFQLQSCAKPFPPHSRHAAPPPAFDHPQPTPTETIVGQLLNFKRNAVFVEAGAYGLHSDGGSRTEWLEQTLGWKGVLLTPDARDYFRLRARRSAPATLAMHACLSTSTHPKEITYQESYIGEEVGVLAMGAPTEEFTARVKCFPLYSILLAGRAQGADFLSLACGGCQMAVMSSLPSDQVHISVVEIVGRHTHDMEALMKSRGYNIAAKTPTSTIYTLNDIPTLKI